MGYLYVPGQADWNSAFTLSSEEPTVPCVSLSGKLTPQPVWWHGWKARRWIERLSSTIYSPSTAARGVESWISSLRATRALSPELSSLLAPDTNPLKLFVLEMRCSLISDDGDQSRLSCNELMRRFARLQPTDARLSTQQTNIHFFCEAESGDRPKNSSVEIRSGKSSRQSNPIKDQSISGGLSVDTLPTGGGCARLHKEEKVESSSAAPTPKQKSLKSESDEQDSNRTNPVNAPRLSSTSRESGFTNSFNPSAIGHQGSESLDSFWLWTNKELTHSLTGISPETDIDQQIPKETVFTGGSRQSAKHSHWVLLYWPSAPETWSHPSANTKVSLSVRLKGEGAKLPPNGLSLYLTGIVRHLSMGLTHGSDSGDQRSLVIAPSTISPSTKTSLISLAERLFTTANPSASPEKNSESATLGTSGPKSHESLRMSPPPLVFLENVRNHLRIGFEQVRGELRGLGYAVEPGIFSAEEVGATHRRERLFVLSVRWDLMDDSLLARLRTSLDEICPRRNTADDASSKVGNAESECDRQQPAEQKGRKDTRGAGEEVEHAGGSRSAGTGQQIDSKRIAPQTGDELADPKRNRRQKHTARAGESDAADIEQELADAQGERLGEERESRTESAERTGGSVKGLADSEIRGLRELRESSERDRQSDGSDETLAQSKDTDGRSGEESLEKEARRGRRGPGDDSERLGESARRLGQLPAFPPGPDDRRAWERILADWPSLEPAVRRVAHGLAAGMDLRVSQRTCRRNDRLRVVGNGVCPLTAAFAFAVLSSKLGIIE